MTEFSFLGELPLLWFFTIFCNWKKQTKTNKQT